MGRKLKVYYKKVLMTAKERMDYYNKRGREVQRKLERMKAANI